MQFTLKTMLTSISVAAVLCCIFFTLPTLAAVIVLGLIWMLAPPALIAGIVYGRGYGRAFCIGCVATGGFLPVVWLYSSMMFVGVFTDFSSLSVDDESALFVKLGFGATFFLMGLAGLTGMAVRFLSLRMAAQQSALAATQTPSPPEYSVLHRRVTTVPARPAFEQDGPDPANEE